MDEQHWLRIRTHLLEFASRLDRIPTQDLAREIRLAVELADHEMRARRLTIYQEDRA